VRRALEAGIRDRVLAVRARLGEHIRREREIVVVSASSFPDSTCVRLVLPPDADRDARRPVQIDPRIVGARLIANNRRCRMHGGLSTGPRTPEGKAKCAEAARRRIASINHKRAAAKSSRPDGGGAMRLAFCERRDAAPHGGSRASVAPARQTAPLEEQCTPMTSA
jgi:hypothetical protein